MFMRTQRLFLRPIWSEDWRELYGAINDEAVVRNLARVPWPYTASDAHAFASMSPDPMLPRFLVVRPDGGDGVETVGCVGFHDEGGGAALGYWVARKHWGKGFATEAARGALAVARVIGHRRILAWHSLDNPASARVLGKLGFRPTGVRVEKFSIGRQEVLPSAELALDLVPPEGFVPLEAELQAA